jgi:hypothetical protein
MLGRIAFAVEITGILVGDGARVLVRIGIPGGTPECMRAASQNSRGLANVRIGYRG